MLVTVSSFSSVTECNLSSTKCTFTWSWWLNNCLLLNRANYNYRVKKQTCSFCFKMSYVIWSDVILSKYCLCKVQTIHIRRGLCILCQRVNFCTCEQCRITKYNKCSIAKIGIKNRKIWLHWNSNSLCFSVWCSGVCESSKCV